MRENYISRLWAALAFALSFNVSILTGVRPTQLTVGADGTCRLAMFTIVKLRQVRSLETVVNRWRSARKC